MLIDVPSMSILFYRQENEPLMGRKGELPPSWQAEIGKEC